MTSAKGDNPAQAGHAVEGRQESGTEWTNERLRAFEESIRQAYLSGEAIGAVHLSRGNESQLIEIFRDINPQDWKFSTWRSHYHALLSGVPESLVRAEILAGRSISLQFPEYRFFTSSIVGGILPIATGVAAGIKLRGEDRKVWCFVGDMTASCGMFADCVKYALNYDLPIKFIVEDNEHSTNTPTDAAWGAPVWRNEAPNISYYRYQREWPHSGFKL